MSEDLRGLRDLRRQLAQLPRKITGRTTREAVTAGAERFADAARSGLPPGAGPEDIVVHVRNVSGGARAEVSNTQRAFWLTWAEFGRTGQAAQPFLRPAFDSQRRRVLRVTGRVFWKRLTKGLRRG